MLAAIPPRESARPNGLLRVVSNSEMDRDAETKRQEVKKATDHTMTALSGEVNRIWELHKRAKQPIEIEMLRGIRQRNTEYDPQKLAAIQSAGGSESAFPLTQTKCRAAISKILDIYMKPGQVPFGISPTPIPDLPPAEKAAFLAEVYETAMGEILTSGLTDDPAQIGEIIKQQMIQAQEDYKDQAKKKSKEIAGKMELAIADMLFEGGFYEALSDCIDDIVALKAAVMRGPVLRKKRIRKWGADHLPVIEEKVVVEFDRMDPFDIYPAPGATQIKTGDLILRHRLTRSKLYAMIGVPGYVEANIRKAIEEYGTSGNRQTVWTDSELQTLRNNNASYAHDTVELHALELWGEIPGRMLTEYGVEGATDPDKDYDVNVWMVGNHVIKAILNPDQLGGRPYSMSSFIRKTGSVWGDSLPDSIKHDADAANTTWRAMLTNSAFCSGPMIEENIDRIAPGEAHGNLHPLKVWKVRSEQMSEAPAIRVHNIQSVTPELLATLTAIGRFADDHCGVPSLSNGTEQGGGAWNTLGGQEMAMATSNLVIQSVIQNVDTLIEGVVERVYDHIMQYGEDNSIKTGDVKIKATGSSAQLVRERQTLRRKEFLLATNNPLDAAIVPTEGRRYMLEETAKDLNFDVEEVFPEIPAQQLNTMGNQAAPVPAQGPNATQPIGEVGAETPQEAMMQ